MKELRGTLHVNGIRSFMKTGSIAMGECMSLREGDEGLGGESRLRENYSPLSDCKTVRRRKGRTGVDISRTEG